jgi:hypothetical protein
MNSLCKKTLTGLKDRDENSPLNRLIDRIVNYEGDISTLSINYLREDNHVAAQAEHRQQSENEPIKDFRICNLAFRNFRTFPKHDLPYGIDFTKTTKDPCSLFLVGKNGTGKSTIFDALEWIYAGKVSNAEDRGITDKEKTLAYLTYGFDHVPGITPDGVELKLTIHGEGIWDNRWKHIDHIQPICVPALCCSDMDLEEIAKLSEEAADNEDTDYQIYVRKQLGYECLSQLKERLNVIRNDVMLYVEKLRRRATLAELNAQDVSRLMGLFESIVENETIKDSNRMARYLRFSDRQEIEVVTGSDTPRESLGDDCYGLKDYWEGLLQNVDNLKQHRQDDDEGSPYMIPLATEDGDEVGENHAAEAHADITTLETQVNKRVKHLEAMYKRLKSAYDQYKNTMYADGLAKTLIALQKDYEFLISNNNLPSSAMDINRELVSVNEDVNPIPLLQQKIDNFLAHLFEVEAIHEEGEAEPVFMSKYPVNLNTFVMDVLNHYREEGEKFIVEVKSNSFDVTIEVKDPDGCNFLASPGAYLNTFRFRLYAVLLKIALAFYYMKENKCVAPVIIDDVFNASDFENTVSLNNFIFTIYDVYQELLGGEYPLQLIILTHDEMILNAFQQGVKFRSPKMIERVKERHISMPDEYCVFGRLFSYKEAGTVNSIDQKERNFLNLYLKTNI